MKRAKNRKIKFSHGDQYLADKVKLKINTMGEVVLISTSLTVLRIETDEPHAVEPMDLSQKQHHRQQLQEKSENERAYF